MDPITQQAVLAAAGAGGGAKTYVDDVFSTFLYEGNNSTHNITNGIDLAGEGGLSWIKVRDTSDLHILVDTERGATKQLSSNSTASEVTQSRFSSFNSDGFTVATNDNEINNSAYDYVSWTFRKAPGFFDVVTYTGNGVAGRSVAHNLGSKPGMILVKRTDGTADWIVYHRSIGYEGFLILNSTNEEYQYSNRWHAEPDANNFYVGSGYNLNNNNNETYVAYVFAHDDAQFGTDSDESIIKCGSYSSNGSEQEINLGFEPQFVLIKSSSHAGGWYLFDSMRGIFTGSAEPSLQAQESNSEAADNNGNIALTATGFRTDYDGGGLNESGKTYAYMAIRRPNKPPEVGTEVFAVDTRGGTSPTPPTYKSGFPVDWVWERATHTTNNWSARTRLTGNGKEFDVNLNSAEGSNSNTRIEFDRNDGLGTDTTVDSNRHAWMFKRTPGFFDVVAYNGTGSATGINHNLGVVPELMLVKCRSHNDSWMVYANGVGPTETLVLNNDNAASNFSNRWNGAPTSSVINVSTDTSVNYSGRTYVAYLFATLSGISKVGSYTGTGNAIDVDCGFTTGARFILVKRTDAGANWYLWDSTRGIVSGNDPYILLDEPYAQATNTDFIDPLSAGFTITAAAATQTADIATNGGSYIFLAIA